MTAMQHDHRLRPPSFGDISLRTGWHCCQTRPVLGSPKVNPFPTRKPAPLPDQSEGLNQHKPDRPPPVPLFGRSDRSHLRYFGRVTRRVFRCVRVEYSISHSFHPPLGPAFRPPESAGWRRLCILLVVFLYMGFCQVALFSRPSHMICRVVAMISSAEV